MHPEARDVRDDPAIDSAISCRACDAVCCRLTVLVMPDDDVPRRFIDRDEHGLEVMAKDEDGWCAAIDPLRMCCSIYDRRPAICREFAMGGGDCRTERENWRQRHQGDIPFVLVGS